MKTCSTLIGVLLLLLIGLRSVAMPNFTSKSFLENKGQLRNGGDVHYYTTTHGRNIYFRSGIVSYVKRIETAQGGYKDHRIDVKFIGSNPDCRPKAEVVRKSHSTFYGMAGHKEIHARHFNQIVYENIYDGIDLVYRFTENGMVKYEFVVAPGANSGQIKLEYTGLADHITLNEQGQVVIPTSAGNIIEQTPLTFYQNREEIKSSYQLTGNTVSFDLEDYNTDKTIIIDPTILWSTYHGGSANDFGNAMAADKASNIYITGSTASSNYPTTTGAHQSAHALLNDIFVSKFDSTGALVWSTYYGGIDDDEGNDITVSSNGDVFVACQTESSLLSVSLGALQASLGGATDAFVIKMNARGKVLWSSYYGGSSDDYGRAIAVDDKGFSYLSGNSQSNNFKITTSAFQTSIGGGSDGYLVKLSPSGKLVWSTFIGGDLADEVNDICLDDSANIYLAGKTSSTNFPVTNGVLQGVLGGESDMVIAKFDSTGARKWASFFGGSEDDFAYGVTVDKKRHSYIIGTTYSDDLSMFGRSFQDTFAGGTSDLAIAQFSPSGKGRWSTYYGGSDLEEASSIIVRGEVLLATGYTLSSNLSTSKDAFQKTKNNDYDGFFLNMDTSGIRLSSSFLGGNSSDLITDGIFYNGAQAFIGYSRSTDYYLKDPEQPSNAGVNDVVLTTVCPELFKNRISPFGATCFDTSTDTIKGYVYDKEVRASYQWQLRDNGTWSNIASGTKPFFVPGTLSEKTTYRRIVKVGLCTDTSGNVTLIPGAIPNAGFTVDPTACRGENIALDNLSTLAKGTFTSTWTFGDGDSTKAFEPTHQYKSSGRYTITLKIVTDSGCVSTQQKDIYINATPTARFTANQGCEDDSISFVNTTRSSVPYTLQWDLGDGTTENSTDPFSHLYAAKGTYTVELIATTDSACADTLQRTITFDSLPRASFVAENGCLNQTINIDNTSSPTTGSVSFDWDLGNGTTATTQEVSPQYAATGSYQLRLIVKTNRGCADTAVQQIEIVPTPNVPTLNYTTSCDSDPILFEATGLNRNSLYRYEWTMGNQDTVVDTTKFTYTYANYGQYNVNLRIYVDSSTCAINTGVNVWHDSLLKADFTTQRLCDGDPTVFTDQSALSSGNISWKWFFGDGNESVDRNPTHQYSLGNFTAKLVISSDSGCKDSITKQIQIQKTPDADFAFDTVCFGDGVQFVDQTNTIGRTLSAWNWSFGDSESSTDQNPNHIYNQGGTYTVQLVATTTDNCSDTVRYSVFQPDDIIAELVSQKNVSCSGLSDGAATIEVRGGRGTKDLTWNTQPAQTGLSINDLEAGTYRATIVDSEGCETTFDVSIDEPEPLEISALQDLEACAGEDVVLATTANGGTEPYQFVWACDDPDCEIIENENNQIKINPSKSNRYTVKVTDANNCESELVSTQLTILEKLDVDAGPDLTVIEGSPVNLNAESTTDGNFSWSPKEVFDDENKKNPTAILFETTELVVSIDAEDGCPTTDTVLVEVVDGIRFPTAFSPNEDGLNDTWEIENIELFPKSTVTILNRWGATLHKSDRYEVPWDGYYNGKELAAGAYFYIIDLGDGSETLTGSVTILK